MVNKKYITYEEPYANQVFTNEEMKNIYTQVVDKTEYSNFELWFSDMLKSGVFERMK